MAESDVVERAVLCASGRVHFGSEYLKGIDPERARAVADLHSAVADLHADEPWCGGGPHVVKVRHRIVTEWGDR